MFAVLIIYKSDRSDGILVQLIDYLLRKRLQVFEYRDTDTVISLDAGLSTTLYFSVFFKTELRKLGLFFVSLRILSWIQHGDGQGFRDFLGVLLRMPQLKELPGRLTKLSNLNLKSYSLDWVLKFLEIETPFVGKRVK